MYQSAAARASPGPALASRSGVGEEEAGGSPGDAAFFCDAMLGGLSRWLRAAGYDAIFEHGIDDADLIARARASGRVLLSSDGGIFERSLVRDGEVRALFVPRGLGTLAQADHVLRALGLGLRPPRCMACGGRLEDVEKAEILASLPPRVAEGQEAFWRCGRCGRLFWKGTHWRGIEASLARLVRPEGPGASRSGGARARHGEDG